MPTFNGTNGSHQHEITIKRMTFCFDAFGRAYQQTKSEFSGRGPDAWYTNESRRFRELLVEHGCTKCAGVDEDKLCEIAVLYRKRGFWKKYCNLYNISEEEGGVRSEKGPDIPPHLAEHYKTEDYRQKRERCFQRHPYCQICGINLAEECHHSELGYREGILGTPEEEEYLIAVCKPCHDVANKALRRARKKHKAALRERHKQKKLEEQLLAEINGE